MKKILLTLACVAPFALQAQKETKEPLVLQVAIAPLQAAPEKPVNYYSVIETPISPLTDAEVRELTMGKSESQKPGVVNKAREVKLESMAKNKLSISTGNFNYNRDNGDWIVKLTTSDVSITATNEKPIGEINNADYLFKYTYNATLTVIDKAGTTLYTTNIGESGKEQEMPKGVFFLNPTYKMRLGLVKNNPEKTKKIVDEMMENKNALILENIVDQAGKALDEAYESQRKTLNLSLFSVKGKAFEELNTTSEKVIETYAKFRALSKKNRIPKEDVDQVMREAIAVWGKYIADNKGMEEKALKGLTLNCAIASTWLNENQKASEYLAKIPEAKMPDTNLDEDASSAPPGTTMILSFDQSAENAFYFNQTMQQYKDRVAIVQ